MIVVTITMIFDLLVSYIKFYYCFKIEHINQTTEAQYRAIKSAIRVLSSAGVL